MSTANPSDLNEAADVFEREATRAEGLLRAAGAIRAAGGIVQAANEAQLRLDAIKAEHAMALATYADAEADAKDKAAAIVLQLRAGQDAVVAAHHECADLLDAATKEASQITEKANAEAAALITDATNQANAIVDHARAQAAEFDPAIEKGNADLAALNESIAAAQKTLDAVNAQRAALAQALTQ